MIPMYPIFKPLALEDREQIISFLQKFPPYSDYTFASLWCWDTEETALTSRFDSHLILRFSDYATGEPLYSLIGQGPVDHVLREIFSRCRREGIPPEVRLVPEIVLEGQSSVLNTEFSIVEDHDNHDYILSVEDIATFEGSHHYDNRYFTRFFQRRHPKAVICDLNIENENTRQDILKLFDLWVRYKQDEKMAEYARELKALKRHFLYALRHPGIIHFSGLYEDGMLIGFGSDEIISDTFACAHFQKAVPEHKGIYQYIWHHVAKRLRTQGVTHFNIEQDLGVPAIRKAKSSLRPIARLRKFIIRHN